MRRQVIFGVGVLILIGVGAGSYFRFSTPNDVVNAEYATYVDVLSADAHGHGMVPDFLPKSARRITSTRNLDLDEVAVEFEYDESDFAQFLSKQPASAIPQGYSLSRPAKSTLELEPASSVILVQKIVNSEGSDQGTLVVNRKQKRALFISTHLRKVLPKEGRA